MGPCANTSIAALGSAVPYVVGGGLQLQHPLQLVSLICLGLVCHPVFETH